MTKDRWSRLAATYDTDHTFITGADLVDAVREHLAATVPRGRVIELGCGTGLYCTSSRTRTRSSPRCADCSTRTAC